MATPTITCKSIIDAKVFSDFSYFHNFILGNRKTGFITGSLFLLVTALLNLFTGSFSLFLVCLVLAIGVPFLYYLFYCRTLFNQIKANHLEIPREAYTITITESGVTASTATERITYPWNKIFRIYRTSEYFFLYIIKNKAFILPSRDVQGASQDHLWELIQEHTKNTRYFTNYRQPSRFFRYTGQ